MKISNVSKIILAFVCALMGTSVFAQGVSSPGFGSVSSPSMPSIDAPTIGGGYYVPGWANRKNDSTKNSQADKKTDKKSEAVDESIVETVESLLPSLTAGEIQTLNVNGVLENVLENQQKEQSSVKTESEVLRQVLSEMEEIKKEQNKTAVHVSNVAMNQSSGSRLLRFRVNGYDVLHTCRTIFISDVQEDGTFLVTGDRKYQSDGATRSETFHLLFRADSEPNGEKSYNAAAAVTQDYLNENSFLYQMSQKKDMKATRTGNLVTLRTTDPQWKLELLIDLGTTSR